ncbi:hypothetical protein BDY24DRAFT_373347 [Mrakia frigida]|uniref:uncharacterized protein n=1 Tax=Mrakia frigida TaxID=29902 RepID=UPI003FCBFB24
MSFPVEILEKIIHFYFQRDELLHVPEDNFTLVTPTRGSTSLLLVSWDFLFLVLPSLYYSISITKPEDFEIFREGFGGLAGEGEEAKTLRSFVRELRIDRSLDLPIAVDQNGDLYPPYDLSYGYGYTSNSVQCIQLTPSHPNFFPNLDRITFLLPSSPPKDGRLRWSSHLFEQLKSQHLQMSREEKDRAFTRYEYSHEGPEEEVVETMLVFSLGPSSREGIRKFLFPIQPKNLWVSLLETEGWMRIFAIDGWKETFRNLVHPSPSPSEPSSSLVAGTDLTHAEFVDSDFACDRLAFDYAITFHVDLLRNGRFHHFPRSVRRPIWTRFRQMYLDYLEERGCDYEEEELGWLLEFLNRQWKWVEEDGTIVGFEEGMEDASNEEET